VFGADNYFSVAGALFLYLDPASTTVTGSVTENTLTAVPVVKTSNTIVSTDTEISGGVNTAEARNFTVAGSVTGTGGTINYQVQQTTRFSNDQKFLITGSQYVQAIKQNTVTAVQTTTSGPNGTTVHTVNHTTPLSVTINEVIGANGNGKQKTKISQLFSDTNLLVTNGAVTQEDITNNSITTGDTLLFNSSFEITGNKNQASSASYIGTSLHAPCYGRQLASIAGLLVSAVKGCN
jgi:hypothetical protein